jgi:uncharacterized membrane protein
MQLIQALHFITKILAPKLTISLSFKKKKTRNFSEIILTLSMPAGKEMGVTDFINSKVCGKHVHEVSASFSFAKKTYANICL